MMKRSAASTSSMAPDSKKCAGSTSSLVSDSKKGTDSTSFLTPDSKRRDISSSFLTPASKRFKQGPANSFTVDSIPPHHFPLGEGNYAVVSAFGNVVNVHLRKFQTDESGRCFATKEGVNITPFLWQSLVAEITNSPLPSQDQKVTIVRDALLLTTAWIEDSPHISIQRYSTKEGFIRQFLPSVCILTEVEWDRLQSLSKRISESCKEVMFDKLLKKKIISEATARSPPPSPLTDLTDAQDILSVSLTETLSQHLSQRMDAIFICDGCLENQANQLGHDCVTMSFADRFHRCGDLAILSIDINLVVNDFLEKNVQIQNYVDNSFVTTLNFDMLLKNASEMYICSDPMLHRGL